MFTGLLQSPRPLDLSDRRVVGLGKPGGHLARHVSAFNAASSSWCHIIESIRIKARMLRDYSQLGWCSWTQGRDEQTLLWAFHSHCAASIGPSLAADIVNSLAWRSTAVREQRRAGTTVGVGC